MIDTNPFPLKIPECPNAIWHLATVHEGVREYIYYVTLWDRQFYLEEITGGSLQKIEEDERWEALAHFIEEWRPVGASSMAPSLNGIEMIHFIEELRHRHGFANERTPRLTDYEKQALQISPSLSSEVKNFQEWKRTGKFPDSAQLYLDSLPSSLRDDVRQRIVDRMNHIRQVIAIRESTPGMR